MMRSAIGVPRALAATSRTSFCVAAPAGRRFAASEQQTQQTPPSSAQANPFTVLEQLGREAAQTAQQAAQRLGEVTSSGSGGHLLQDLQSLAQANAVTMSQQLVPLFTAMLILARATPGQPLTAEQQEKLAKVIPAEAGEVLKSIADVLPEDPQVTQLKRIADHLEAIEAKLNAAAPSGSSAAGTGSTGSASPGTE
mmetsp:Transcript_7482/g.18876  ORF Transcript_7482/g.18876 Transcript_7482/m.18876 type:complete len:196 (-) Transcript_7482:100-687(-)